MIRSPWFLAGALLLAPCLATAATPVPDGAARFDVLRAAQGDYAGRRPAVQYPAPVAPQPVRGDLPADWHALGPFGGDVADVAASPTAAGVVLAGIAPGGSSGGRLYRSTDDAASWTPVGALASGSVYDIAFAADGTAFIATDSGVWSSSDDGASWTRHDLGIGVNQQVFDVAVDPGQAGVVWAAVADAFGSQPVNLVRSGDGGASWEDVTPPHAAPMSGTAVAIDPADSDNIAAVFAGSFGGGEAWVSTDGGASWTDRSAGLPPNPLQAVAFDGARLLVGGGQLFGSQYVGLYASDDLGATWTALHDGSWPLRVVTSIAIDPADPDTLLVGTDGAGVNRTRDGGATWETGVGGSGAMSVHSVRFVPGSSSEVLLGVSSLGVWRSDDAGDAFASASTGISELALYAIATSPTDPGQLAVAFQGNNSGGVLTSADGGATWITEGAPPTRYSNVAFGPDGTLYAISSGPSSVAPEGLYRRNGDGTWTSLGPNQGSLFESDLAAIRFGDTDPDLILLGGVDFGVAGDEVTVWRSADAGASWTKVHEGAHGDMVKDIEIVPGSADQDIVAAYDGFTDPQQGGALASSDGGLTWAMANSGLPPFARMPRLCSSPADPGNVMLALWQGWGSGALYRSSDGGASWTPTGWSGPATADIACDADDGQSMFLAVEGSDAVLRSSDGGATFVPYADGLENAGTPTGLALSRSGPSRLYLSSPHGSYATALEVVDDTVFRDGFDGPG